MMTLTKLVVATFVVAASTAGAQGSASTKMAAKPKAATAKGYKKDLPDSLLREAKIGESAASATALAKVPNGKVESVELEREGGKLLYSYDIKVAGKKGIDEVQVDAMTGGIVGNVVHESPAAEKKEAADEAKEKKAAAKPKATKKPPTN
jgi:uncharacterized membrane protein YkoI